MSQQPEALRPADVLDEYRLFADNYRHDSLVLAMVAEIERLRAELTALRGQEPVAWLHKSGSLRLDKNMEDVRKGLDSWQPLYLGAGCAQPATPSTQITPNWIWSWLMDWCKRRGVPPSNYDSLFQMASDALYLASGAQPAPSVPGRATMIERLKAAVEGECDGLAVDDRHAEAILDYVFAAAPEAPKRKPLTDEQIQEIWNVKSGSLPAWSRHIAFARAVEAAHGIKENSND